MPARGWLQRVRHNTYTVCYVRLVADHHLLVVPHSPRPAHLIRTVILHNWDARVAYTRQATTVVHGGDCLYVHNTSQHRLWATCIFLLWGQPPVRVQQEQHQDQCALIV